LADDVTLDELIMAKDDLSGADIKVSCTSPLLILQNANQISLLLHPETLAGLSLPALHHRGTAGWL